MNIAFVLPPISNNPCGGYKIVYEYANRFTARGHQVMIIYDGRYSAKRWWIPEIVRRQIAGYLGDKRIKKYPTWFQLDSQIKKISSPNAKLLNLSNVDAIIATAYGTAELVANTNVCNKLYFIQGFEAWNGITEEQVMVSYRLGMKNVVITKWLGDIVDKVTAPKKSFLVPNGINDKIFNIDREIITRREHSLSMLYHIGPYKGTQYGIQAIEILKKIYPDLKATLFGVPSRPSDLPDWIEYVQNATELKLRKIYNQSAVYIYPTIEEGLGLTCLEAMICGAALCVTNYKGAQEFAVHNKNALISPIRDVQAMVDNVSYLFENQEERTRIAVNGHNDILDYRWDKSVDKFLEVIQK